MHIEMENRTAMTKMLLVVVALAGCSKKDGGWAGGGTGSGSGATAAGSSAAPAGSGGSAEAPAAAKPVEDVSCDVAAKQYAKKMAATPGNVLSDAKPDDGL